MDNRVGSFCTPLLPNMVCTIIPYLLPHNLILLILSHPPPLNLLLHHPLKLTYITLQTCGITELAMPLLSKSNFSLASHLTLLPPLIKSALHAPWLNLLNYHSRSVLLKPLIHLISFIWTSGVHIKNALKGNLDIPSQLLMTIRETHGYTYYNSNLIPYVPYKFS